ncbi:MAG: hypothetical protein F6K40_12230 [Okeania sp. SIO3I5]|uniref:hypothetical protein n=1 Tax=Okeania sp. SIO3I5 TaxID=2607805 RepID=UPI0013B73E01|nr:hypothetical protein [Okeania sp. SIO3I5]NEQ36997.1 hypothetical protein [Okeania sp. SIO3I5]
METKYQLIFRSPEECELNSLGIQNSWSRLQDFNGEKKEDSPEITVIAAEKDGFESPFYKLLGFYKLSKTKAGSPRLTHLINGKGLEDLPTVYYQEYKIPPNIEDDMKTEHQMFNQDMYEKWRASEVKPSTNEAGNAKKVAT